MRDTMVQNKVAIRIVLVAVACVVALGVAAMFVRRAITTMPGDAAPATSAATPEVDAPAAAAPSVPAVTSSADSSDDAAEAAREASWRESREATIRMQQRLRAEQQARKSAEQVGTRNERCVDGQRLKRVENGWVQSGNC